MPATCEPLNRRPLNSPFAQTPLDGVLAGPGVSRIVLAGAAGSRCLRATAGGALERGNDPTLRAPRSPGRR
ncbi:MAG: isochorismatase family protein [Burkholderiales bacterium]|nr:isochorismatase family protein [Burkholderiales bacterium]